MAAKNWRKLKVYAALADDISNGHVWLKDDTLKKPRGIVRIASESRKHGLYCEALQIEDNFLRKYKNAPTLELDKPEKSIVMSFWYRSKLGISGTQGTHRLKICNAVPIWGHFWACVQHPHVVVRVAVILGGIGVMLSAIGAYPTICAWARAVAVLVCRAVR